MKTRIPTALAMAILASAPTASFAQQPAAGGASHAVADDPDRRFEEGARLFDKAVHEDSRDLMEQAYAVFKAVYPQRPRSKAVLLNLIITELRTERTVDAMRHLRDFVRAHGTPKPPNEYASAFLASWDTAFKLTAHLQIDAPSGVQIAIDGEQQPNPTPFAEPLDVAPGHHRIEAQGAEPLSREVDAAANEITKVRLVPAPASNVLPAAPAPTDVPSSPPPTPTRSGTAKPIVTWTLVGATAAAFVVGVGFTFAVKNDDDQQAMDIGRVPATANCATSTIPACQKVNSDLSSRKTDGTIAFIGYVSGGALLAATLATIFLWNDKRAPKSEARLWIAPGATDRPSVLMGGAF